MAKAREELQTILEHIMGGYDVYYQPPDDIQMSYPCIVYERGGEDVDYANNLRYKALNNYSITLMDYDADSEFVSGIAELDYCRLVRCFKQNGLHHFIFELYY